ncbi:MAG: RNA ligase family protein [Candidatus Sulfotelmatobacter sp.]
MQVSDYSNIYQLGSRNARNLFDGGPLVVQEKVDGSQFSFANVGDTLHCRSKNNAVDQNTGGMFARAFETAEIIFNAGKLPEGWVARGEVLSKPKHNVLKYERTPVGGIILYDIEGPQRSGVYHAPGALKNQAEEWGLEVVPTFAYEAFESIDTLRGYLSGWLARTSILGGVTVEGVVVKNYRLRDQEDNVLMAKYVSEAFKEKAIPGHNAKPEGTIVQQILAECGKEAIWQKAVQHLRDAGALQQDPKDIGALVKEIKGDFTKEHGDEIKSRLAEAYYGEVMAGILNGFPQWYKAKLAEVPTNEAL